VRGGGHGNWPGINNIGGQGVTLDLGALNAVQYDGESQTVRLGPAAKWKNVYAELEQHGRAVCGAREAEVGVGGFLLGGGNSFYTARLGFACDNVVAYELVVADGRVLNVDASGPHAGKELLFSQFDTYALIPYFCPPLTFW
jgi:FAD/FMN-containing dehydrogenase